MAKFQFTIEDAHAKALAPSFYQTQAFEPDEGNVPHEAYVADEAAFTRPG